MKVKTSEEDFAFFSDRVKYWQDKFSLYDWDILCVHQYDRDAICAWMIPNDEGKIAQIGLNTIWTDTPVTKERMAGAALHEIIEIMLRELTLSPKSQNARHGIINRIESYLKLEGKL